MFYWHYYLMGFILIPGIILSLYAEIKVQTTYNKYSTTIAECGKTASEIAQMFLNYAGLSHIQVVMCRGHLSDHYNHAKKVVALSESVYNSTSVSAIGIACHEVGHALQYKSNYAPIKFRNFIIPICNASNTFLFILIFLGALFYYTTVGTTFLWIGVGIFGLSVLLNLITLPVEYNASKRAIQLVGKSTVLNEIETEQAKEVLKSAALTYVAALVVSILNLLRLLFLVLGRRRRD